MVVRTLLPVLRALVARELMETYGWTQSQVADRLGVTQPAVSGYIALLERDDARRLSQGEVQAVAKEIARGLADGDISLAESVRDICELCIRLKSGGAVCVLHKQRVPELRRETCETCIRLFAKGTEQVDKRYNVLSNIRKAIALVEGSKAFPRLMPEVMVNIVEALPGAKTVSEVAGIPGRIAKVRGMAKAFVEPEFGASFHMAAVLLAAMGEDRSARAVINTRFDEEMEAVMHKLDFTVFRFGQSDLPEKVRKEGVPDVVGVKMAVKRCGRVPDVVVSEGGYGVEPAAYFFGDSSVEAVRKAIRVAEELSA
jgi:predicted fused transcriptional regulator/phosphomethylpyrimidine kinase/predicted transcriptional regulator